MSKTTQQALATTIATTMRTTAEALRARAQRDDSAAAALKMRALQAEAELRTAREDERRRIAMLIQDVASAAGLMATRDVLMRLREQVLEDAA